MKLKVLLVKGWPGLHFNSTGSRGVPAIFLRIVEFSHRLQSQITHVKLSFGSIC